MSTKVNLNGRLTRDPELKFSQKGTAVTTFAVVTSERYKDDRTQDWKERNTTFWEVVAFGDLATNCAESLAKGTAVIVQGRAYQEEWEARDGTKRRSLKVTADDVAPSMRWDKVTVNRSQREKPSQPKDDDWSSRPADSGFVDEPSF